MLENNKNAACTADIQKLLQSIKEYIYSQVSTVNIK